MLQGESAMRFNDIIQGGFLFGFPRNRFAPLGYICVELTNFCTVEPNSKHIMVSHLGARQERNRPSDLSKAATLANRDESETTKNVVWDNQSSPNCSAAAQTTSA